MNTVINFFLMDQQKKSYMKLSICFGDFGIWVGIPLFWAVAPVRDLSEGDVGWFGVGFGYVGSRRKLGGGWRILF